MANQKRVHLIHREPHSPTIVEPWTTDYHNDFLCQDPETDCTLTLKPSGLIDPPTTNWLAWVPQQGFTLDELKILFRGEKDAKGH